MTWAAERAGLPGGGIKSGQLREPGDSIVREPAGLKEAFRCALERSDKDYVLVEEMLSGTEIGVDGVVQNIGWSSSRLMRSLSYHSEKITIPAGHGVPLPGL